MIPIGAGGKDTRTNTTASCYHCNLSRAVELSGMLNSGVRGTPVQIYTALQKRMHTRRDAQVAGGVMRYFTPAKTISIDAKHWHDHIDKLRAAY